SFVLSDCEAYTPVEKIHDAIVCVDAGRISWIGPRGARPLPSGAKIVSLNGRAICPGFIDLQVNGLGGDSLLSGEAGAVSRVAAALARRGTASFLPTLTTEAPEALIRAAEAARHAWEAQRRAKLAEAEILGVHLEGPFLSPEMRGAHPAAHLRAIDLEEVDRIAAAAGGYGRAGRPGLCLITLSPELRGAAEAARQLAGRGVIVAMGHTAASDEEIRAFVQAGGRFAVHAFNRYGQGGPAHRSPGPMGIVQADPQITAGLIADGVHVRPGVAAAFVRAKGWERTILTSDLVSDRGLSGNEETTPSARTVESGGILSGSRLSLGEMVPLFRAWSDLPPGAILSMATSKPAQLLGLFPGRGQLSPGAPAHLCVLHPESLVCEMAMVGGEWVMGAEQIEVQ
ncbi:MAG: amidohydrolase family protein, partial [bacterium]|nr:amidohydrolase family protein [bacterium]